MDHKLKDGESINNVDDPNKDYEFETCIRPIKGDDEFTIPSTNTSLEIKKGMC